MMPNALFGVRSPLPRAQHVSNRGAAGPGPPLSGPQTPRPVFDHGKKIEFDHGQKLSLTTVKLPRTPIIALDTTAAPFAPPCRAGRCVIL